MFTGFSIGHIDDHVTVPLGVAAKTILKGLGYQVRFSHYPIIQHPDDLNFAALSQSLTNPINLSLIRYRNVLIIKPEIRD